MYLESMVILCVLSIIILGLISRMSFNLLNAVGLFLSLLILVYNAIFIILYNKISNFQIFETYSWLMITKTLNWGDLIFTVDGISIFFITLSVLLIPICILMS